jgi:hypothetical protein
MNRTPLTPEQVDSAVTFARTMRQSQDRDWLMMKQSDSEEWYLMNRARGEMRYVTRSLDRNER